MRKFRENMCFLLGAVLVAGMLAGCGGSSSRESGSGASTDQSGAANTTSAASDTDTASGGSGKEKAGTLKVGVSGTPNLDPAVANTGSELIAFSNLYDTLVVPSDTDETGVEPRVAESYEISDDGLTYTFHIKSGIKFHNGDELKASDVVYSVDRFLTIGEGYSYIFENHLLPGKTEAPDDTTVIFHLEDSYGPFLQSLVRVGILNEKQVTEHEDHSNETYEGHGDYGKNWLLSHDAGSGAYQAVELVQQDYFYAEKFDDWFVGFDNQYAPEAFKQMAITEAATVRTMINNKELDITDTWQSTETLSALEKMDGVSLAKYSNMLEQNIYINTTIAPMDDVNIRRAMSCLVDYDTVDNSILVGSTRVAGPTPTGVKGHTDTAMFDYDPEKAKSYIAASRYADSIGDYTIEIVTNSDVSDQEKIALMIQSAGQQIGLKIEVTKAPWVSLQDMFGSAETSPMMTLINSAPPIDDAATYLQSRYSQKTQGTWENGEWLSDEKLDADIQDALTTVDDEERMKKEADIQNYIVDELCPSIWLCNLTERCAYHSDYIKWPFVENASEGEIPTTTNGFSQVYANMEYHPELK